MRKIRDREAEDKMREPSSAKESENPFKSAGFDDGVPPKSAADSAEKKK